MWIALVLVQLMGMALCLHAFAFDAHGDLRCPHCILCWVELGMAMVVLHFVWLMDGAPKIKSDWTSFCHCLLGHLWCWSDLLFNISKRHLLFDVGKTVHCLTSAT